MGCDIILAGASAQSSQAVVRYFSASMATQRIIDSAGTWPNEHSAGRRSESQAFILRALFQRQVERRWSCRVSQEERASRWPETSWILPPITAWDDSGRHHPLHRLADAFSGDGEKEKDGLVGWHSSAGLGTCICLGTAGNAVQRAQASRLTFHHPTPPIHHDSQLSTSNANPNPLGRHPNSDQGTQGTGTPTSPDRHAESFVDLRGIALSPTKRPACGHLTLAPPTMFWPGSAGTKSCSTSLKAQEAPYPDCGCWYIIASSLSGQKHSSPDHSLPKSLTHP